MDSQPSLFTDKALTVLEGVVTRVRFTSEDDAWSVVVVTLADSGREVTVVGNLAGTKPGESLRLSGKWSIHRKFGEQFTAESFTAATPATAAAIERYLGSGLISGVGKGLAARLVGRFGLSTLDVIESQPARLREVEGIGPVRADQIVRAWRAQRDIREVMVFLQSCGVSTALAARIYSRYGKDSHDVIRRNPWQLAAEVAGIGFHSADAIAKRLGVAPDSPHRAEAGVLHALELRAERGDTWAPREALAAEAVTLLGVDSEMCRAAVEALVRSKALVQEEAGAAGQLVALPRLARAEADAAALLSSLLASPSPPALEKSLEGSLQSGRLAEHGPGIALSDLQLDAVRMTVRSKVLVITGGPGTGKTTLITAVVRLFAAAGARVALCAPTGRAAKRLSEAAGREARTIHRLLEWSAQAGGFQRNARSPIPCDILILDETSMVDAVLFSQLLAAVPSGCRLVLVGDSDQLPSVGPGAVLAEVIASGVVPVVSLTEIFRQAEASRIVVNAHRINSGLMPLEARAGAGAELHGAAASDFFFIEREDPESILSTLRELVTVRIPRRFGLDPREDLQVLTPMRKGALGTGNLNRELQALLNPAGASVERGGVSYRPGDRVMQLTNNYDSGVFNGDIGSVADVDEAARSVVARFDEREVRYEWADLDQVGLSYACSIHKAQGSEFPAVVVVLHTQHYVLLKRTLLYTAVTRGRKLVVLVGSRRALAMAVKSAGEGGRCSLLAFRLRALSKAAP
jgi:exodeoxyribonuclease V alpha subunit